MRTAHEHEAVGRPIERSILADTRSVGTSSRPRRELGNAGRVLAAENNFWKIGPPSLIWKVMASSSGRAARAVAQLPLAQMASKSPFLGVTDHLLQLPTTTSDAALCLRDHHDLFLLQTYDVLEERSITDDESSRIGEAPIREVHYGEDAGRCRDSVPPGRADCRYVVQLLFFSSRGGRR